MGVVYLDLSVVNWSENMISCRVECNGELRYKASRDPPWPFTTPTVGFRPTCKGKCVSNCLELYTPTYTPKEEESQGAVHNLHFFLTYFEFEILYFPLTFTSSDLFSSHFSALHNSISTIYSTYSSARDTFRSIKTNLWSVHLKLDPISSCFQACV